MTLSPFVNRLLKFLKVRSPVAGLEISDAVLRFAIYDGKNWKLAGLRLPQGLIENGIVRDQKQLVEALRVLRREIFGPKDSGRRRVDAAVSLSSVNIFSQVFSLPMVEGENLEKAIQLNIQMVSPAESSETYAGWQLVGQDQKALRLEILSAFIDRKVVDAINQALHEAGFVAHSIESRALSLTRLLREKGAGFDPGRSYLVLSVDASGLELFVVRKANLYFQYFTSWRDIQGEKREISREDFAAVITRNLHQVINFYKSHWPEPLEGIFVSASSMNEEITATISQNFPLKIFEFRPQLNQAISPDWFVAVGSGLRNLTPHREDKDISLLGVSAQEEFRRHQLMHFVEFWRLAIPAGLALLLAAFLAANIFVGRQSRALEAQVAEIASAGQIKEIAALEHEVKEFNQLVALIKNAELSAPDKNVLLKTLNDLLKAHGLTLRQLYYQGSGAPILLRGWAKSEENILNFKRALDTNPMFQNISLPFSDIKPGAHGLSFSVTFSITP